MNIFCFIVVQNKISIVYFLIFIINDLILLFDLKNKKSIKKGQFWPFFISVN